MRGGAIRRQDSGGPSVQSDLVYRPTGIILSVSPSCSIQICVPIFRNLAVQLQRRCSSSYYTPAIYKKRLILAAILTIGEILVMLEVVEEKSESAILPSY